MQIVYKKLDELKPYDKNPRKNDRGIEKVRKSIEQFGFSVPILVSGAGEIVAGHTRYEAAKRLGMVEVPCIKLKNLSDEYLRQYRIIDNKTGELSSWDYEKLLFELADIPEIDMSAFEFGHFEDSKDVANFDSNLDAGKELDLSAFDDESFENECPFCGYRWSE